VKTGALEARVSRIHKHPSSAADTRSFRQRREIYVSVCRSFMRTGLEQMRYNNAGRMASDMSATLQSSRTVAFHLKRTFECRLRRSWIVAYLRAPLGCTYRDSVICQPSKSFVLTVIGHGRLEQVLYAWKRVWPETVEWYWADGGAAFSVDCSGFHGCDASPSWHAIAGRMPVQSTCAPPIW
jgi:hypothetical protein